MASRRPSKKGRTRKRAQQQVKAREQTDEKKEDLLKRFKKKQKE